MARILIVDDDRAFRDSLAEALGDLGYEVLAAGDVDAARRLLDDPTTLDLALIDLRLPGEDGMALLREARRDIPDLPCVILTAYASGQNTIEAMRLGAFDHLTKPIGREQLQQTVQYALAQHHARQIAKQMSAPAPNDDELITASEPMRQTLKRIGLAAASDATVLILGETGTGKELVAHAIHRHSARAQGPFVAVNCAAIPTGFWKVSCSVMRAAPLPALSLTGRVALAVPMVACCF